MGCEFVVFWVLMGLFLLVMRLVGFYVYENGLLLFVWGWVACFTHVVAFMMWCTLDILLLGLVRFIY